VRPVEYLYPGKWSTSATGWIARGALLPGGGFSTRWSGFAAFLGRLTPYGAGSCHPDKERVLQSIHLLNTSCRFFSGRNSFGSHRRVRESARIRRTTIATLEQKTTLSLGRRRFGFWRPRYGGRSVAALNKRALVRGHVVVLHNLPFPAGAFIYRKAGARGATLRRPVGSGHAPVPHIVFVQTQLDE